MMKNPVSFLGGLLTGLCAMYFLDSQNGARRRALLREKFISTGRDAADLAQAKSRRALDRARGIAATHSLDGVTRAEPQSDWQLHERIRSRLGHVVSHPKAVVVDVTQGRVRLHGHVLRREVDALCSEVESMSGVEEVRNDLQVHDSAEGIPELQGRQQPPGRESQPEGTGWH